MKTWNIALACGLGLLAAGQASACYTVYGAGDRVLYQGEDAPVDMRLPIGDGLAKRGWVGAQMVFDQGACPGPGLVAASPTRAVASGRAPSVPAAVRAVADAGHAAEPDLRTLGAGPRAASRSLSGGGAQSVAATAAAGSGGAPLLTDRATAQRLGLPSTPVSGDIVMVPASVAARVDLPTFTVVESMPPQTVAAVLSTGPERRPLGAPPAGMPLVASRASAYEAAPDTAVLGAGSAALAAPAAQASRAELAPTAVLGAGPRHVLPGRTSGTVITELRNPPVTVTQSGQTIAIERNR